MYHSVWVFHSNRVCVCICMYVSAYVHDLFCFHLHITHIVVNCICRRLRLCRHRYFCMEIKSSHGKPLQRPICINILEKMCVTKTKRIIIKRRRERRKTEACRKSGWKIKNKMKNKKKKEEWEHQHQPGHKMLNCVGTRNSTHTQREENPKCSIFCIMYVTRISFQRYHKKRNNSTCTK